MSSYLSTYSYTQSKLLHECPRKYSYIYQHKIKEAVGAPALFSSHLVHPALSYFYKNKAEPNLDWWGNSYAEYLDELKDSLPGAYVLWSLPGG